MENVTGEILSSHNHGYQFIIKVLGFCLDNRTIIGVACDEESTVINTRYISDTTSYCDRNSNSKETWL